MAYTASESTLVYDRFDRANSTTLGFTNTGHKWEMAGTSTSPPPFGIIDNMAYNPAPTPDARAIVRTGLSTGIKIGVDIVEAPSASSITAITFRQREKVFTQACYLLGVNGVNIFLQIRGGSGGSAFIYNQTLASLGLTFPVRVEAVLKGETVECYANGQLLTTIQDKEHTNNPEHGMWQHNSTAPRFDNFAIDIMLPTSPAPTIKALTGASTAASSIGTAPLRRQRAASGATTTAPNASGDLTVNSRQAIVEELAGSSLTSSTASGMLTKAFRLSGASGQGSTAGATLRRQRKASGALTMGSRASAELKASAKVTGASTSSSEVKGHFTTVVGIEGASTEATSASGVLDRLQKLTGSTASTSTVQGELDSKGEISLTGSATSQPVASGNLKAASKMTGTAIQATHASATLDAQHLYLSGASSTASSSSGSIKRHRSMQGSSEARTTTGSQVKRSRGVYGTSSTRSTSSGSVGVIMWVSGASSNASKTGGHMVMAVALLVPKTHLEGIWRHRTELDGHRGITTELEGTKRTKTHLKGVF